MAKFRDNKPISIGSVDIYVTEWTGKLPSDIPEISKIETKDNFIGHTKDGATLNYTPTYYTAESDDGMATETDLTKEEVTVSFGIITWNGDTICKFIPTAKTEVKGGYRYTEVGGIDNDNGKKYLIHLVHKPDSKNPVRYDLIGRNIGTFAIAYKPGQETTLTPDIKAEPFENGRLYIMREGNGTLTDTTTESAE